MYKTKKAPLWEGPKYPVTGFKAYFHSLMSDNTGWVDFMPRNL